MAVRRRYWLKMGVRSRPVFAFHQAMTSSVMESLYLNWV